MDETLRTRADDIFAAGDIAAVPDPTTGKRRRIEHWAVAERQGQHAARAMLGSKAPYPEVPFFWSKQYDFSLKYLGYGGDYERVAFRGSPEEGGFLAGYYGQGRLLAVAAAGRPGEVLAAGEILREGTAISFEDFENEGTDLAGLLP